MWRRGQPQGRNALSSQMECIAETAPQVAHTPEAALAIVIMAAGKGTRLKSRRTKVLHEVGGRPLLGHVIDAATAVVPADRAYVVIGHQADQVREAVAGLGVRFVEQTEQKGTGHAIQCAGQAVAGFENILVLSGDVPLIRPETLERLWQFHRAERAAMTLLTASPTDASIYAFRTAPLFAHLGELRAENAHGELYVTDMAHVLRGAGERVVAVEAPDAAEVLGANTLAELASLDATLRAANARRLMASGVTIFRPETCVIDAAVEVAPDTVIEPFVQLLGATRIGSDCRIRSFTVIENCVIGDSVEVRQNCVLSGSSIASGAKIGPFAHLRAESQIGENAHIGNFVETKKTRMANGAKANHFAYLGDS